MKDVVFYWTRGNYSVSGLDTLQLAQYTLEDYYTSESEAVYETGESSTYRHVCKTTHTLLLPHVYTCTYINILVRAWQHTHTHTFLDREVEKHECKSVLEKKSSTIHCAYFQILHSEHHTLNLGSFHLSESVCRQPVL